jgi:membrane protease YdiL (CAAX protease family)
MGLLSIFFYWRDGYEMTWAAFRERMRLGRLSAKTWLVVSGLTLLVLVLEASLEDLGPLMASVDLFSPPEWLGAPFNPNEEFPIPPSKFMGTELLGQWWIPLFYIPCLLANILGEELFWRGYMLPRQELVFGRWAFLVNGVFWIVLFHVALPWIWLTVIPSLVLIPLTAQILKSTWAPIVIHGFGNFILMIILVVGVLGL